MVLKVFFGFSDNFQEQYAQCYSDDIKKAEYMVTLGYHLAILMIIPLLVSFVKVLVGVTAWKNKFGQINLNKYFIITCTANGYFMIQQLQVFLSLWPVLRIDYKYLSVILSYVLIYLLEILIL